MPTITKKLLEDYEQPCRDRNNDRLLPRMDCVSYVKRITMMQKKLGSISWRNCRVYARRKKDDNEFAG